MRKNVQETLVTLIPNTTYKICTEHLSLCVPTNKKEKEKWKNSSLICHLRETHFSAGPKIHRGTKQVVWPTSEQCKVGTSVNNSALSVFVYVCDCQKTPRTTLKAARLHIWMCSCSNLFALKRVSHPRPARRSLEGFQRLIQSKLL